MEQKLYEQFDRKGIIKDKIHSFFKENPLLQLLFDKSESFENEFLRFVETIRWDIWSHCNEEAFFEDLMACADENLDSILEERLGTLGNDELDAMIDRLSHRLDHNGYYESRWEATQDILVEFFED